MVHRVGACVAMCWQSLIFASQPTFQIKGKCWKMALVSTHHLTAGMD
jgi:hypothetical protein